MTSSSFWRFLFGRRERRADDSLRNRVLTRANGLTLVRAAISSAILAVAISRHSRELLLLGLGCSMVLDFADGALARALERETVLGAQLDGLADRLTTVLVSVGVVSMDPSAGTIAAVVAVWLQFGLLDFILTFQFLAFPDLWSPDHFHEAMGKRREPRAERVWRLNWSAAAKLASNLSTVLLAAGAWWAAIGLSALLIAMRVPDYFTIRALVEERQGTSEEGRQQAAEAVVRARSVGRRSRTQHQALH
jgi:phosphatidylglycerophosphate synthase